jgi:hypothetical protein
MAKTTSALRDVSRVESREFPRPNPTHVAQTAFESCDVTFAQFAGGTSFFCQNDVRALRDLSRVECRECPRFDPRHVAQTSFGSYDATFPQSPGDKSLFGAKITFARLATCLASNLENFQDQAPIRHMSHRLPLKVVTSLFVRALRDLSRVECRECSRFDPRRVAQTFFGSCDATFAQPPGDKSFFK